MLKYMHRYANCLLGIAPFLFAWISTAYSDTTKIIRIPHIFPRWSVWAGAQRYLWRGCDNEVSTPQSALPFNSEASESCFQRTNHVIFEVFHSLTAGTYA